MLVITGPNGGGKSTLAKVLAGIEDANGGEIFLDEENITGYDIDHRANAGIGYAFQQPPRFKGMTVKKMLSLAAGKELTEAESCKLLSAVGLCSADYLNRQMDGTLSGGEMKRLEIATVCSPGGTTIEAVAVLERENLRSAVIDATRACIRKSKGVD